MRTIVILLVCSAPRDNARRVQASSERPKGGMDEEHMLQLKAFHSSPSNWHGLARDVLNSHKSLTTLLLQPNLAHAFASPLQGFHVRSDTTLKTPRDLEESLDRNAIQLFLSPHILEPEMLEESRQRLQNGNVVVWKNAFKPDLAEEVHAELNALDEHDYTQKHEDGFYSTSVVDDSMTNAGLHRARSLTFIFNSPETKRFMEYLSGRNCEGAISWQPSLYKPGDFHLPFSGHIAQRTVAFAWHLSKSWDPEWGGAMQWIPADEHLHPEFNTLYLFSVTPFSAHGVTKVSPEATQMRLSIDGWWNTAWLPKTLDDVEALMDTEKPYQHTTADQMGTMMEVLQHKESMVDPQRRAEAIAKFAAYVKTLEGLEKSARERG